MGHARRVASAYAFCRLGTDSNCRNYVTQDVLRRIMTDYFGYDVHFVMNVTDIDDKVCVLGWHACLTSHFILYPDYPTGPTESPH